jgi:hypothetical protein
MIDIAIFEHATQSLVPGVLILIPDDAEFRSIVAVVKYLRRVGNPFDAVWRGRVFTLGGR